MLQTSAFVPELQKLTESQDSKAPVRSRKISKKEKEDVDDDDDDEGDGSEEHVQEEDAKHVKLKGKNTTKQGRKPPAKEKNSSTKVKPQESEKNVDQVKKTRGGKKPPVKRKSKDSDDEHDDDQVDSDDDKEDQEIIKKKHSKAKNQTAKTGKQPKKRAR